MTENTTKNTIVISTSEVMASVKIILAGRDETSTMLNRFAGDGDGWEKSVENYVAWCGSKGLWLQKHSFDAILGKLENGKRTGGDIRKMSLISTGVDDVGGIDDVRSRARIAAGLTIELSKAELKKYQPMIDAFTPEDTLDLQQYADIADMARVARCMASMRSDKSKTDKAATQFVEKDEPPKSGENEDTSPVMQESAETVLDSLLAALHELDLKQTKAELIADIESLRTHYPMTTDDTTE